MKTEEVTIHGAYPLSGTLSFPADEKTIYPAVLIISGSGKGDRDGNEKNLQLNLYNDLAEFLTMNGFITLRYDKRGINKSGGNYYEAGLNDLIEDAVAAVKFLQSNKHVDQNNTFILGHSEGALIAPAVQQQQPVSGLILLAGAARPSKEISEMQIDRLYAEMKQATGVKGNILRLFKIPELLIKQNKKTLKKVVESSKDVIRIKGVKMNAKWLRETLSYDVRNYLREITCPVLAISGEKDIQVPPEDAEQIAKLVPGDTEWKIIDKMNHILRKYDGNHTTLGIMKEYKSQLGQLIDRELLDSLITWLNKHVEVKNNDND